MRRAGAAGGGGAIGPVLAALSSADTGYVARQQRSAAHRWSASRQLRTSCVSVWVGAVSGGWEGCEGCRGLIDLPPSRAGRALYWLHST